MLRRRTGICRHAQRGCVTTSRQAERKTIKISILRIGPANPFLGTILNLLFFPPEISFGR